MTTPRHSSFPELLKLLALAFAPSVLMGVYFKFEGQFPFGPYLRLVLAAQGVLYTPVYFILARGRQRLTRRSMDRAAYVIGFLLVSLPLWGFQLAYAMSLRGFDEVPGDLTLGAGIALWLAFFGSLAMSLCWFIGLTARDTLGALREEFRKLGDLGASIWSSRGGSNATKLILLVSLGAFSLVFAALTGTGVLGALLTFATLFALASLVRK